MNPKMRATHRRFRPLLMVAAAIIFIYYFLPSMGSDSEFYEKTVKAMEKQKSGAPSPPGGKPIETPAIAPGEGVEVQGRLKEAEQMAKDNANKKSPLKPDSPSDVVGVGSSANGQRKKEGEEGAAVAPSSEEKEATVPTEQEVDSDVSATKIETELNAILKRSPVIIFSKTYCDFSKRAKALLLEKYTLDPAPYVVELDEHDDGMALQELLQKETKLMTVPNIMVNGVSLGGADDIQKMDEKGELVKRIMELGEARKVTMVKN